MVEADNRIERMCMESAPKRIGSVHPSDTSALQAILGIHISEHRFAADVTYSKGGFYKNGTIPQPLLKLDLHPQHDDVVEADFTNLPMAAGTLDSIVFDPPFIVAAGKNSLIGNRFSSYPGIYALRLSYRRAIAELARVLVVGGRLVVKCQDTISSGKYWANTVYLCNVAEANCLEVVDKLMVTSRRKMHGHNHHASNQAHTDRMHCVFWVFGKRSPGPLHCNNSVA